MYNCIMYDDNIVEHRDTNIKFYPDINFVGI